MGRTFVGFTSLRSCAMRSSGMSAVISCTSVRDRIHSLSSNIFVVGSFSFFRNMSCALRRQRHSSGMSPVAHFNCEDIEDPEEPSPLSSTSKGSDGMHMFLTLACRTCGTHGCQLDLWSEAAPVLLRPCSLMALRAAEAMFAYRGSAYCQQFELPEPTLRSTTLYADHFLQHISELKWFVPVAPRFQKKQQTRKGYLHRKGVTASTVSHAALLKHFLGIQPSEKISWSSISRG